MDTRPKLRGIEAFPVNHEGRRYVALRDPAGFTPSVLLLSTQAIEVIRLFDGARSVVDIQAELMRRLKELVTSETIESMIETLDEHGFLDSPRFAERRSAIDREFLLSPVRAASHAGGAYPGEAAALRATMDGFFAPPAGPGPIASWATDGAPRPVAADESAGSPASVVGVIAPHIDFHRGGPAYAWAYRDVAERCTADLFVIFGTSHAGLAEPFAVTRKSYDTPLGPAAADRDLIDRLAKRAPVDVFAAEPAHRSEHSIEFQAVFLRYLLGDRRDFTIVPVLTSFAHEAMIERRTPDDDPRVTRFFDSLRDAVATSGRRVAFIAGADLAHVGPRFGDRAPLDRSDMARVERADRAMLETVEAGDPRAFFTAVTGDGDRRRICGLSPIWSLLHVLGGRRGTLRHYGHTGDPDCLVSFASVVFS